MAGYRDVHPALTYSSDDTSSDSDNDVDQPWKRRKTARQSQGIRRETTQPAGPECDAPIADQHIARTGIAAPPGSNLGVKKPRRNNIWGQVVLEQNEALVTREMDEFGMDLSRSRDVESYNYKLGREEGASRSFLGAPSISKPETVRQHSLKRGFGETADDSWLVNQQRNDDEGDGDVPRKPVHERLGERDPSHRKIAKARLGSRSESPDGSPMKFISIDPSLSLKEITGMLAYSLQEAKRELIVRVVDVLGVDKSLELWRLTTDIEKSGGMMVMNGSRRRLPGGVFLQLMKTDPQVTKSQVNEIFAEEKKKDNDLKHKRDKRRRKKTVQFKDIEETGDDGADGRKGQADRKQGCSEADGDGSQTTNVNMEDTAEQSGRDLEAIQDEKGGRSSDMEDGEIEDEEKEDEMRLKEEKMT